LGAWRLRLHLLTSRLMLVVLVVLLIVRLVLVVLLLVMLLLIVLLVLVVLHAATTLLWLALPPLWLLRSRVGHALLLLLPLSRPLLLLLLWRLAGRHSRALHHAWVRPLPHSTTLTSSTLRHLL
jgi:hypothetical protein